MFLWFLQNIFTGVCLFSLIDAGVKRLGFGGAYYFVHGLHNLMVAYDTWPDVVKTITNFHHLDVYTVNYNASALVFALHFYHILVYYHKLRYDDYLHHGLMIFVALPIGVLLPASSLTGFSLFVSTGLMSFMNYFMLFAVRNGWMDVMTEKRWNSRCKVWLRSPGCIAHATLTLTYMLSGEGPQWQKILGCIPAALMLWNGQYFMVQVVENYAIRASRVA